MARQSRRPDGRPAFQFYPDDWLSEGSLRLCSLAAHGLWIDLLCQMFKMEERGKLRISGKQLGSKEIAGLVGKPEADVKQALSELQAYKVCETADDGTIYSRRMVREEKQRLSKVEAGRKGGQVKKPSRRPSKTEAKGGSPSPSPSSLNVNPPTPFDLEEPGTQELQRPAPTSSTLNMIAYDLAARFIRKSHWRSSKQAVVKAFLTPLEAGLKPAMLEEQIALAEIDEKPWDTVKKAQFQQKDGGRARQAAFEDGERERLARVRAEERAYAARTPEQRAKDGAVIGDILANLNKEKA